jgi:flagellar motor switch protein FliM
MDRKMDKKIQTYNFKRPDRISKNQIRSLHFVHDRFARNASSSISAYLRMVVEISLDAIEQVTYADFLTNAADPTCYASISLKPLDGQAALEVRPECIFPMIDRLLGGSGEQIQTIRPMTEIEQRIIQAILKLLVDNLKESWRPVYSIDFATTSLETHPHMVQVVGPNEMIIHFKFKVRMKNTVSHIHLAFPTLVLEPIIHIFDQDWHNRKKIAHDGSLLQQLRQVPVSVSIETSDTSFPMQSLVSLEVGDTLVLDQRTEWPMQMKIAGRKKLLAKAKFDSSKKMFAVTTELSNKKEEARGHAAH